jgi:hypothetical protein
VRRALLGASIVSSAQGSNMSFKARSEVFEIFVRSLRAASVAMALPFLHDDLRTFRTDRVRLVIAVGIEDLEPMTPDHQN